MEPPKDLLEKTKIHHIPNPPIGEFNLAYLASLHNMLVEMHAGMLVLAIFCIVLIIIDRIHLRVSGTNGKSGDFWSTDSGMGKLSGFVEPTSYVAGIGGVISLIISAIVGSYTWPSELITSNALGMGKVLFSIFATELWFLFVFVRSKYGLDLWKESGMAIVYSCVGLLGFLFTAIAGSLGAHMSAIANMSDKGSVLDPIYELLGIDPLTLGVIGSDFLIYLTIGSIVLVGVPIILILYLQRRK